MATAKKARRRTSTRKGGKSNAAEARERYRIGRRYIAGVAAWCNVFPARLSADPSPDHVEHARHVYLASLGARVRLDRGTKQALAVRIVVRWKARCDVAAEPVGELLAELAIVEPGLRRTPLDQHTERAAAKLGAVGLTAWLMVRTGLMVGHAPTEPDAPAFRKRRERAKDTLRKALHPMR